MEEVFNMPKNEELSKKYGLNIYDDNSEVEKLYYVLERGEWMYESEIKELAR